MYSDDELVSTGREWRTLQAGPPLRNETWAQETAERERERERESVCEIKCDASDTVTDEKKVT